MNLAKDPATLTPASTLDLRPLLLVNMACTLSMMAFVALIGPIARLLGMATWQAGAAVTVAGVVWVLLARPWGRAADRLGRRRVLLLGSAGFTLAYWLLCLFIDGALRWLPGATLAFIGLMLTRGLIGAFYAALPVAGNALIADHVEPQRRARAMASLGAANAVGLVLGPAWRHCWHAQPEPAVLRAVGAAGHGVRGAAVQAQATAAAPAPCAKPGTAVRPTPAPAAAGGLQRHAQRDRVADHVGFFALDRLQLAAGEAAQAAGVALTSVGVALMLAQVLLRQLEWPPLKMIPRGCQRFRAGLCRRVLCRQCALAVGGVLHCRIRHGLRIPGLLGHGGQCHARLGTGCHRRLRWRRPGHGAVIGPLAGTLVYAVDPRLPFLAVAALLLLVGLWPAPADKRH
jgi:MFS family permease